MTRHGSTNPQKGRRMASPETVDDELVRQERAYVLRMGCMTFQQIADSPHPRDRSRTLYAGASEARRGFIAARDRHAGVQQTAEIREEWRQRNEAVFASLMPTCLNRNDPNHHWAIDRYTRLFAEHAKMLGLMVDKIQVSAGESELDEAYRELTEQLAARAAGRPVPTE